MYNKKVLIDSLKNLGSAKAPTKHKDNIYINKDTLSPFVSSEGFKQGPPPPGTNYRIPGNTLYNPTPYSIDAVSDNGIRKTLKPYDTKNIHFPGANYVDEFPQMQEAKQGGALLTQTMTCGNCGWKWKAADGGSDITTCHKCGGKAKIKFQDGGPTSPEEWGQQIKDIESQIGHPDNWTLKDYYLLQDKLNAYRNWRETTAEGQAVYDSHNEEGEYDIPLPEHLQDYTNAVMKARLAYANEFGNPAAKRMINIPDNPYQFDNGDIGTHYMASYDNYAVPQIQDENGELVLGDYGPESNEAIKFDSNEDANYFAEHYKDVSPGFINAELTDDEIQEYKDGGYIIEDLPKAQLAGAVKAAQTALKVIPKIIPSLSKNVTQVVNKLGTTYLPNMYNLNPLAVKENPYVLLHRVQKPGQTEDYIMNHYGKEILPGWGRAFSSDHYDMDYYTNPKIRSQRGYTEDPEILRLKVPKKDLEKNNIINFNESQKVQGLAPYFVSSYKANKEFIMPITDIIKADKFGIQDLKKLYKEHKQFNTPHWWKGFQEVPKQLPGSPNNFKSSIDWRKWVKYTEDFDNNPNVIKHLNEIEETTKANGTWMKNPDGSAFKGTQEEFVVQQSDNFKNAFGDSKLLNPDGSPIKLYHGSPKNFEVFDESMFQLGDSGYSGSGIYTTPNKSKAESYTISGKRHHSGKIEPTLYELYGRGNNPITSKQLIDNSGGDIGFGKVGERKDKNLPTDLFNFHRDGTPTMEQLLKYDVAIKNQQRGISNIRPIENSWEIVFPTNKQLKSAKGNILLDMTNPNMYKSILPYAIPVGLGAASYLSNPWLQKPKQLKHGGISEIELTDAEIDQYINAGYTVEELPKAPGGGPIKKAVKAGINFTSNNPLIKSMYKGFNSADFYNPAKGFNPAIFNKPQERIVHYLKDDDLIMPGFNLNEDMDLKTKSSKLQEFLNKPLVPYTKNKLPKNLDLNVIDGDNTVRVLLKDAKTKKVYGQLGLQKHDNDWFVPSRIDVNKELWGHKVQDVLYQSGIDAVQNKGYKGIRSGDTLLSPAKTAKAHARFNTEVLGPFTYQYLDDAGVIKDIGITGLTGHKDSDLYDNFFSYYSSLPKNVKDKHSINDLYDKFKNHMSKNKYKYLAGTGLVGAAAVEADTIILPLVNKDYKSFLLDYSKKYDQQKRDQQLKEYDEKLKKELDAYEYNTGGAIDYELGDEIDEATMQELKELGYTFEKI